VSAAKRFLGILSKKLLSAILDRSVLDGGGHAHLRRQIRFDGDRDPHSALPLGTNVSRRMLAMPLRSHAHQLGLRNPI
jgi:hypothetical protein